MRDLLLAKLCNFLPLFGFLPFICIKSFTRHCTQELVHEQSRCHIKKSPTRMMQVGDFSFPFYSRENPVSSHIRLSHRYHHLR